MESLVEQLYSIPRPALVKCLFACHLIVHPSSNENSKIVNSQGETEKMIKVLKLIFNSKNCDGR